MRRLTSALIRHPLESHQARVLIVGSKSQLAIQYAHQVRDVAPDTYVFWVHASTRARFEEAYRGIADKLQLQGRQDPEVDVLRLVSDWLCDEANSRWTMVIDNADDIETFFPLSQLGQDRVVEGPSAPLADYLPQSPNGSILVTSRSRDAAARLAGGYHNTKHVLAMDESQGLELLRNKLSTVPADQSTAVELVRILDRMPLAITQAAAYINRRAHMTIASYICEFRTNDERRESLLNCDAGDLRRDKAAANSVVTTWQMSFERIRHERPSAADLLSLMSFFNPQDIPKKTLRSHARTSARVVTGGDQGKADRLFDEDIDVLYAYSLLTVLLDKEAYEMHPLVQFCTRIWLSSCSEVELWRGRFIQLLAQEFPSDMYPDWAECQRLLPHIEPLLYNEPECEETAKAWASLLIDVAFYLLDKGSYQMAHIVAANAVTTQERILGPDDQQTLLSINTLSSVLLIEGKYDEAVKLSRRVLAGRQKELGEDHLETLRIVGNLSLVLDSQGEYDEAEKLGRRALTGMEKQVGENHLDTLVVMANLAMVLQHQGKYEEAEKLSQRALTGREKELGENHPQTLLLAVTLAMVLWPQGKYDEAEKLGRRALAGLEKQLGELHQETLASASSLGLIFHATKRYPEAEALYERAYNGYLETLGAQHARTIAFRQMLLGLQQEAKEAVSVENSRQEDRRGSSVARTVRRLFKRNPRKD